MVNTLQKKYWKRWTKSMAFKRANKPTPYNTLGKKPKKFKKYRVLKDGTVQHWDKEANGKRGGWRPKKGKQQ